ncbi:LytTR family DNA-binding domain-containing protein [Anaeromicropila herbilytica]|uniref:LytR family transcriptional regulator n=1 Tax=Anaeromicropila herbilytica TaxID=2785025 RepID=A0A7R7EL16_9FIRM|nr:LytTR family DNA-binding domain-containing protein [Anaeromicropila herbilytica]BCN30795.1 LytR family transcriptional regulator [Anaeromicropila herbilytica]
MRVRIEKVNKKEEEHVLIRCCKANEEVLEIIDFIKSRDDTLLGYEDARKCQIPLRDVYYFEGVDNKVYAYLKNNVYEIKNKLYELEEIYSTKKFFRCSKSVLVNLLKIESVKPALNGRFNAKLLNGEQVIISRSYVPELKKILRI